MFIFKQRERENKENKQTKGKKQKQINIYGKNKQKETKTEKISREDDRKREWKIKRERKNPPLYISEGFEAENPLMRAITNSRVSKRTQNYSRPIQKNIPLPIMGVITYSIFDP
jgi:hypothetical protein